MEIKALQFHFESHDRISTDKKVMCTSSLQKIDTLRRTFCPIVHRTKSYDCLMGVKYHNYVLIFSCLSEFYPCVFSF